MANYLAPCIEIWASRNDDARDDLHFHFRNGLSLRLFEKDNCSDGRR
jgi:hypothetical protein